MLRSYEGSLCAVVGLSIIDYWGIIALWSSAFSGMAHTDDFVWLMFVHTRNSTLEQTLDSQKHLSGLYHEKHKIEVQ